MRLEQTISLAFFIYIYFIQICLISTSDITYRRYLEQFGYAPKVQGRLYSALTSTSLNEAIKKLQRFYKLPETGQLDERTKELMERSRCGNPDVGTFETSDNTELQQQTPSTQARFAKISQAQSSITKPYVWPKTHLKWAILQYPSQQTEIASKNQLHNIMKQAFNDWEKYSGLTFEMVTSENEADLKIKFVSKDHDDKYPFDDPGVTLAHAFFPQNGGIHFDDDESFTDSYEDQNEKYTLRLVAAHEIGHALGLNHSSDENSLMFPVYQQFSQHYEISDDDKRFIQSLYGTSEDKTGKTTTSSPTIPTNTYNNLPVNNWCSGDFQTGCEGPDGELYLFKDNHVWRYRARTKHSWDPQPTLINQRFRSLKDTTITGCVKSTTGYTYLFSSSNMWKVKTHWDIEGPNRIQAKNYPKNHRSILFHNNSIYFIQNNVAYSLNEKNYNRNLKEYSLQNILNPLPKESIHSGFTYDRRHYIFTRNHVYVYDSTYGNLLEGYPKSLPNGWFACDTTTTKVFKWNNKSTKGYDRQYSRDRNHHRHNHHHHDVHDEDYHHHHHRHGERRRPGHHNHEHHRQD